MLVVAAVCMLIACTPDDDDTPTGASDGTAPTSSATPTTTATTQKTGTGASETGSGTGSQTGSTATTPQPGTWSYVPVGDPINACAAYTEVPAPGLGTFVVDMVDDASFTIAPDTSDAVFDCTLAAGEFGCPEQVVETIVVLPDAAVTAMVELAGTLASSTEMTGHQRGHLECVGAECSMLGVDFPCHFSIAFSGRSSQ